MCPLCKYLQKAQYVLLGITVQRWDKAVARGSSSLDLMHLPSMPVYLSHDCYIKKQNLEESDNHQQLHLQKQPGNLLYIISFLNMYVLKH